MTKTKAMTNLYQPALLSLRPALWPVFTSGAWLVLT